MQKEWLFHLSLCIAACAAASLSCVAPAFAETDASTLVRMHSRVFDLGTDVSKMRRDDDFVPMNEIPWLEPILDDDLALRGTVFTCGS